MIEGSTLRPFTLSDELDPLFTGWTLGAPSIPVHRGDILARAWLNSRAGQNRRAHMGWPER